MLGAQKGITRLPYFLISTLLNLLAIVIFDNIFHLPDFASYVLTSLVLLPVVYLRVINIGFNPLMSLVSMIPLADWFLEVPLMSFQENYTETKHLDKAGRLTLWIPLVLAILLGLIGGLVVAMSGDMQNMLMKATTDLMNSQLTGQQ